MELLTVNEVAKRLKISRQRVHQLVLAYEIEWKYEGHFCRLYPEDVKAIKERQVEWLKVRFKKKSRFHRPNHKGGRTK